MPIQGNDFAARFESPLTDKSSYFLENQRWFATPAERAQMVLLFAQSLNLTHGVGRDGDKKPCSPGLYVNKRFPKQDSDEAQRKQDQKEALTPYDRAVLYGRDSSGLEQCVKEIAKATHLDYELIDGSHFFSTKQEENPKAADLVTALAAGYKWTKDDDKFALANAVKLPAWFDYQPVLVQASPSKQPEPPAPIFWLWDKKRGKQPDWHALQYALPKGYQWKHYYTKKGQDVYALVQEGSDLARDEKGRLETEKGRYFFPKPKRAMSRASLNLTVAAAVGIPTQPPRLRQASKGLHAVHV